ncbi:MAG: hypothetical protein ACM3SS_09250 [Rhodospirillaceae bacterium]
MSKKSQPDTVTPADTDGAETLRQQPQSGTPQRGDRVPLTGAEEPHERDESPESQPTGSSPTDPRREDIGQASEDIERGLVDTDRRGTPDDIPHQEHTDATRSTTRRP